MLLLAQTFEFSSPPLTPSFQAFINECLSTLHPNGSSLLPYMVANLEQGETLVFKPEEANAKEQDDEMAPPPAKRHCPASTTNNNVTMAVDRASSSPNGRKVAATSEENSDIDPPLVNAIARLHDVCKTHDIGRTCFSAISIRKFFIGFAIFA